MATADPAQLEARVRAAETALATAYGRTLVEHRVTIPGGAAVRVVEYPAIARDTAGRDAATGRDAADARPPILLLHGIASVTALAVPVLGALADRRVLAVDWPGHGLSDADVIPPGTEVRAHGVAVLDAVLAAFQLDPDSHGTDARGTVDVIGHSLGGQLALYLALAHPGRIRRLVLLGAPGGAFSQARPTAGMRMASIPGIGTALLGLSTSQHAHDRAVARLIGADALAGYPAEISEIGYLASQRPEFAPSVASLFRAMMTPLGLRDGIALTPQELAHLDVPTLIVWGIDDVILPPDRGRASAGALPRATILELEGGHAPWLNDPARVGDSVSAFLTE